MNEKQLFANTEIILKELKASTSDYFNMLTKRQQSEFVSLWKDLNSQKGALSFRELLIRINETVFGFPDLRDEFLGETTIQEIERVRFNPGDAFNSYEQSGNKSPTPNPAVVINNEVKDILAELELTFVNLLDNSK